MTNNFMMVNRRGKKYEWKTFNGDDFVIKAQFSGPVLKPPTALDVSGAVRLDAGHIGPDVSQTHSNGNQTTLNYFFIGGDCAGPYRLKAGERNVMAPGGVGTAVVSVDKGVRDVKAALTGKSPEADDHSADKAVETTKLVMQILFKVGTGLLSAAGSAMPSAGTKFMVGAMSNSFNTLGTLALSGLGGTDAVVPEPPKITDMENALRFVVQEAESRNDASLFTAAYRGFQERAVELAAILKRSGQIPEHLSEDLEDSVHRALAVEMGDSFDSRLQYQTNNPESARYILPQLIVAMGLYVHLKRLHMAMVYLPARISGGCKQIPTTVEIEHLLGRISDMKTGLINARSSFESLVNAKLTSTGLAGTPEAIAVIKIVGAHYFGDADAVHHQGYKAAYPKGSDYLAQSIPAGPDQVDMAIASLDKISAFLLKDIDLIKAGKWPRNILNVSFTDEPAGATA